MQYQTFSDQVHQTYEVAILVPKLSLKDMAREYVDAQNLDPEEVIAYQLHQTGKKTSASDQRDFLDDLMPILEDLGTKYVIVGEADYFKTLAGVKKAEAYLGYVLPNAYPESLRGQFSVIYAPNYRQVFHNPGPTQAKITQAFNALWDHRKSMYRDPGCNIISFSAYPQSVTDIAIWLQKLIEMDQPLTADIEAFSLKHHSAGIGTISFAWSKHEGIAFPVDLGENPPAVRKLLLKFFREFKQKLIWHNISYDVYVLIYQLFMEDLCDTEGLLDGLEAMLSNWDDTKLITYLATNSCAGNELGLKAQSQEFSGNYAVEEINDITLIPLPDLLQYNLIDSLSTWFVHEKHWDTMVADDQLEIYETIFKPAILDIIQMQLTGMPVDMGKVREAKAVFEKDHQAALRTIQGFKLTKTLVSMMQEEAENQRYEDWLARKEAGVKVRAYAPGNFSFEFNPNSGPQMQRLLYELAGLPVIEKTDSGQAATGKDVLEKLKAYTEDQAILDLLDGFLGYAAVEKLLTSFIPALEASVLGPDGCYYLFGNFNLGGTLSGRLSSSKPNLQNLPAHGAYAKLIKDCFRAPDGWLFVGLDFASLEDRISALTTKDPNKLKVYIGHSIYKIRVDETTYWVKDTDEVHYQGCVYTGAEFAGMLGASSGV